MARISVPPVDAPISNTIALPRDGKITAKQRSSHMSPVSETVEGIQSSKSETYAESAKEAKTLQRIARRSRNMNPKTTKMMLRIHMKTPTGSVGTSVDRMTETPEVPPNAK